jgi:hypothetical protein
MSNFSQNYQPEAYPQGGGNFQEGDYRLKILDAFETQSRNSGNAMIQIETAIAEASFKFRYYIVDGEYFNANATKVFDCFKITRGNFDLQSWIGKYGKGHIAKGPEKGNGKSYWELAYLIVDTPQAQAAARPAAPAQRPAQRPASQPAARQPTTQQAVPGDDFTDDIPF